MVKRNYYNNKIFVGIVEKYNNDLLYGWYAEKQVVNLADELKQLSENFVKKYGNKCLENITYKPPKKNVEAGMTNFYVDFSDGEVKKFYEFSVKEKKDFEKYVQNKLKDNSLEKRTKSYLMEA